MTVITIRGQLGGGADEVGRLVAEKIRGDYVEREIIAMVAEKLKAPHEEVAKKEATPSDFWGRLSEVLSRSAVYSGGMTGAWIPTWDVPLSDTRYLESLHFVITELAKKPPIVIRGRGSQFILKTHPGAFHALIVAPQETRLLHVMKSRSLTPTLALKEMERFDSSRRAFIKRYFNADLDDPVNYDIVINTGRLSYEDAARFIVEASAAKR
jgi:cytidylate kinase